MGICALGIWALSYKYATSHLLATADFYYAHILKSNLNSERGRQTFLYLECYWFHRLHVYYMDKRYMFAKHDVPISYACHLTGQICDGICRKKGLSHTVKQGIRPKVKQVIYTSYVHCLLNKVSLAQTVLTIFRSQCFMWS